MFTPNSIYHILSKLFDPVDLTSHLIFVKIYLTGSLCCYGFHGQNEPKILQKYHYDLSYLFYATMFHTILNDPIIKKTAPKINLRRSKIGGGSGVGFTAVKDSMVFLKASLMRSLTQILH